MNALKNVTIYTDGACLGNPGKGGYGVVLRYGNHSKELSGGFRHTTNNRMEILAAIVALETLNQPCQVTLHTDSKYLVDAIMQGWAKRWQKNKWQRNSQEKAKNSDLWARLLKLCAYHRVTFVWVKGHAGIRDNERCDQLAVKAAKQINLEEDMAYGHNGE